MFNQLADLLLCNSNSNVKSQHSRTELVLIFNKTYKPISLNNIIRILLNVKNTRERHIVSNREKGR